MVVESVGKEPSTPSPDPPEVVARIQEGLPLVDVLARAMRRQLGPVVSLEDQASVGREALLHAARSFDPDRGIPFRKWAAIKMRGAMIDAARSGGALPKRVYRKLRALQAVNSVQEVANEDQAAQPAKSAEEADAQLSTQLASAAMAAAVGFLAMRGSDDLTSAEDDEHSPESNVANAQLITRIRAAIDERPEQERTLLLRHYFEETNLDDIAKDLGLSKSWASRLHARAIEAVTRSLRRSGVG